MRQAKFRGDAPGRTWSLRREWSRAFTIMLVLLLVAASTTIVGVWGLVDGIRGTAHQLHVESVTVSVLRTELVAHEEIGHKLLSGEPVDRSAYVAGQNELARLFDEAAAVFPTTNGMKTTIDAAQRSWRRGLMTYGLWGATGSSLHGNHATDNPTYGASSDATNALLAGIEGPSLDLMDQGLAHDADLEHILMVSLATLFGLAAGRHRLLPPADGQRPRAPGGQPCTREC